MRRLSAVALTVAAILSTVTSEITVAYAYPQRKTISRTRKYAPPVKNENKPETKEELNKRHEAARREIKQTEEQIRENDRNVGRSLAELNKLEREIAVSKQKVSETTVLIGNLENEIGSLENEIKGNEEEIGKLRSRYLESVKKVRGTHRNRSVMAFIFSSANFFLAYRRMRYLDEFSKWKQRQTEAISTKTKELDLHKRNLEKSRTLHADALLKRRHEEENLHEKHTRQTKLLSELKHNGKELKKLLAKKQEEANDMKRQIDDLIAREERLEMKRRRKETRKEDGGKEDVSGKRTSNEAEITSDGTFAALKGKLPLPVSGGFTVVSRFGRQSMPDLPSVVYDNPGIDAESSVGASATAVHKGKVSGVYMVPGFNTVVIVNHGGYYTVYGNISAPAVKVGDEVSRGSNLGSLAPSDGNEKMTAIHFEVWKGREKLDPLQWLR